mgnify:CR=1 FL=1
MKPAFSVRGRSDVFIGPAAEILPDVLPAGRVVAVSDAAVAELHGRLLAPYETLLVGRGEEHKTLRTVETLCRRLIGLGADRKTFILGVGGGIVTDVAGFAASIYMRGLPFGFVSTTLLGQVDASVGGKNGVNVDGYKNMAGTFTQPRFVVCDPALLRTLPEREFRAGLAEAVKAGIIADAELFARLERLGFDALRGDTAELSAVVSAAVRVKAEIVERDEYEAGDRRKLNLGHTLGHAIEKCSDAMNHGEAVAVGTALAGRPRPYPGIARTAGVRPHASGSGDAAVAGGRQGQEERGGRVAGRVPDGDRRLRGASHDARRVRGVVRIRDVGRRFRSESLTARFESVSKRAVRVSVISGYSASVRRRSA